MGVCTADVDGDGWEDLYVTALGGNKLYRNNHDGTLRGHHRAAAGTWRAGLGHRLRSFADYDRDGRLDLFIPGTRIICRIYPRKQGNQPENSCLHQNILAAFYRGLCDDPVYPVIHE